RLTLKELREILRDRRTIVTLLVMPMIVYPLLALVFQRFLLTSLSASSKVEYIVGTDSEHSASQLIRQLETGEAAIEKRTVTISKQENGQSVPKMSPGASLPLALSGMKNGQEEVRPTLVWVELSPDEAERQVIDAMVHLAILPKRNVSSGDENGL